MLVFVFPGQGSQKKGMGAKLFDTVPEFAAVEAQVDGLLGYSLRKLCLEDPGEMLKQTEFTQPCLYTVNALHYYHQLSQGKGKCPKMVAGHSLGEYNALLAAGAYDFMTGLRLVQKRGELMSESSSGVMAAVISLDVDTIQSVIDKEGFTGIDIANYNSPTQIVISGVSEEVKRVMPALDAAGALRCIPLSVSAAFHSRLMEDAASEFEEFLGQFSFKPLEIPVISNVTGTPYPLGNPSSVVRWSLVQQICGSVQWMQSIRYLRQQGATEIQEVGPGKVLTQLIKQIY